MEEAANGGSGASNQLHIRFEDGFAVDPALAALAERYLHLADGDLLLALVLAAEDGLTLRAIASRGLLNGRRLHAP